MARSGVPVLSMVALVAGGLLVSPPAGAQSIAAVARKERERRAEIQRAGNESPVIGSRELEAAGDASRRGDSARIEPQGGNDRESDRGRGRDGSAERSEAPPPDAALTDKEARKLRETWSRLWRDQMAQARTELDVARNDAYQCRTAENYFFVPLAVDCDGVEERLILAEARLREVQQNRYNWKLLLPRRPDGSTP